MGMYDNVSLIPGKAPPKKLSKEEAKRQADIAAENARLQQIANNKKALDKLLAQRPAYQSVTGSQPYKDLSALAAATGDLPQYALLKQQAESAASTGRTRLGGQLSDELQNQALAGAGAQQNAYSDLAMGGGLSSGARERIASSGVDEQLRNAQAARLANQRSINDLEANLQSGLLDLGAKSAADRLGIQQGLLQSSQTDLSGLNQYNQGGWQQKVDVEAARQKAAQEQGIANKYLAQAGKKIICTKLYQMGLLDEHIYKADQEFGRRVLATSPHVMLGYLAWATPVVSLMTRYPWFAHAIAPISRLWANQMAYELNGSGKKNFIGKALMVLGYPICSGIGKLKLMKRKLIHGV